jgi:hypothetical protein
MYPKRKNLFDDPEHLYEEPEIENDEMSNEEAGFIKGYKEA